MGNPYAPPDPGRPLPRQPAEPPAPQRPPAPRRPDPQAARAAARLVVRFTLLMLAGLLSLQLPVPWQAVGLLFTGAGLVAGVAALRRVVTARLRGTLVVSLALGLVVGSLLLLMHVALLAVWPETRQLQECRSRALTIRAQEQCDAEYQERLRERSQLTGAGHDTSG